MENLAALLNFALSEGWDLDFLAYQVHLYMQGVRDERVHDAVLEIMSRPVVNMPLMSLN